MSDKNETKVDEKTTAQPDEVEASAPYRGYEIRTAADLVDVPDEQSSGADSVPKLRKTKQAAELAKSAPTWEIQSESNGASVTGHTSVAVAAAICFFVLSVVFLILAILGSRCKLGMCSKLDRSSTDSSDYSFKIFSFAAPFQYIMAALCVGSISACAAYAFAVIVLQHHIGTAHMVDVSLFIREGAKVYVQHQYMYAVPVVITLFILTWFATNGRVAGSYAMGALSSATFVVLGIFFAGHAIARTTAAARESAEKFTRVTFQAGMVIGLAVLSCGLGGLSACYLIFRDVHALAGFLAGVSTMALFAQISSGIFATAASTQSTLLPNAGPSFPVDDPRNSAMVAEAVGDCVGKFSGFSSDVLESFVAAIGAASILGSALPYFMKNPYALCVYNHLYIDETCVMYDKPTYKLSLAGQICKTDSLYESYPDLEMSQSNAMFVAFPFLLGVICVIACILCSAYIYIPKPDTSRSPRSQQEISSQIIRSLKINILVATIFVTIGSAILSWGMFGSSSKFQKGLRGVNENGLPRYELTQTDASERCKPLFFTVGQSGGILPEGQKRNGTYQPLDSFGNRLPRATSIPWRLFLSVLVGQLLGLLLMLQNEYFTSSSCSPTKSVASTSHYGPDTTIIQSLGLGMLSVALPVILVMATVLGTYKLFGSYGVALAAIGILSVTGLVLASAAFQPYVNNARSIAAVACESYSTREALKSLQLVASRMASCGRDIAGGSAILAAYAVLAAVLQETSLAPSPRQLVGMLEGQNPTRHITDGDKFELTEARVVVGIFLGIMLPYIFGGLMMIGVSRGARVMCSEIKIRLGEVIGPDVSNERTIHHRRILAVLCRVASLEMIMPGIVAITFSLIIGYGLGQRALIGMLMGAVGSGYLYGAMLSHSGSACENARDLIESSRYVSNKGDGSQWHQSTLTADTAGKSLRETCGPAMNVLIKVVNSYALIAISTMRKGHSLWYVGFILLICTAIAGVALSMLRTRIMRGVRQKLTDKLPEWAARASGNNRQPPLGMVVQSGFHEAGPSMAPQRVAPGSQTAQEHAALEGTHGLGALGLPSFAPKQDV